jgi:formamidase
MEGHVGQRSAAPVVRIDPTVPLMRDVACGHNRWHEAIAPVLEVETGAEFVLETRDAYDRGLGPNSSAADVPRTSVAPVHPLTGPVYVRGAEPGDRLEIAVLDIEPDPWRHWGYTVQTPGEGFLGAHFVEPFIAHWTLEDRDGAVSAEVPGVRIPYAAFPGVIGVAPSAELRSRIIARESNLGLQSGYTALPDPDGAVPPTDRVPIEGLRTIPPEEYGGNMDVKLLTPGNVVLLPVFVEGGLLSVGDLHYAQGHGETCETAIEMAARVRLRVDVLRGEALEHGIEWPEFRVNADTAAASRRYHVTTGTCLAKDGIVRPGDLNAAAANALLAMIAFMERQGGYRRDQAYAICSVAVDLHIAQAVNMPNVTVVAQLPLDIFE